MILKFIRSILDNLTEATTNGRNSCQNPRHAALSFAFSAKTLPWKSPSLKVTPTRQKTQTIAAFTPRYSADI
jgi:hypothetical protein